MTCKRCKKRGDHWEGDDGKTTLYQDTEKPYSKQDYEEAKERGLDLDNWNDYVEWAELGEYPTYD